MTYNVFGGTLNPTLLLPFPFPTFSYWICGIWCIFNEKNLASGENNFGEIQQHALQQKNLYTVLISAVIYIYIYIYEYENGIPIVNMPKNARERYLLLVITSTSNRNSLIAHLVS